MLDKLKNFFNNSTTQNTSRFILSLTAFFLLINYVLINKSEFSILLNIPTANLIILIGIKFFCVYYNSLFQKVSLNIFEINIQNLTSLKITSRAMLINQLLPFRGGVGYRMYYLRKHYKIKVKEFGKLISLFYFFNLLTIVLTIGIYIFFENNFMEIKDLTFLLLLIIFFIIFLFFSSKLRFTIFLKYFYLFLVSILSNFFQYIFVAYTYLLLESNNFISDALVHLIIHISSSLINLTPGSIGIREYLLFYFQDFFAVNNFQILTTSILDRIALLVVLIMINLFFKVKNR